jgi:type II secretory pathway component PulJ
MSIRRKNRNSGFTLVEIMIALGIFMMVIFAIYSTWSAVLRGSKTGLDAAATAQRSRVAIHAVEDSLTCATMFSANPAFYSFLADTDAGDFSSLTFTSHLPMSFPGAGLFGDQAVRRVSFYVEPDPLYRRRLVMMQTPLLQEASEHPEGYPLILARGVKEFLLEYWDIRKGEWATDPPPTNQLPAMVRVTLSSTSSTEGSAPPETVTRIVRIASTAVSPSMQAPLLPPGVAPFPGPGGIIPGPGGGTIIGGTGVPPPPGAIIPQSLAPTPGTGGAAPGRDGGAGYRRTTPGRPQGVA